MKNWIKKFGEKELFNWKHFHAGFSLLLKELIFFFLFVLYGQNLFAEKPYRPDSKYYLDSALMFLREAGKGPEIDQEAFGKAKKMLRLILPDEEAIRLVEAEAAKFRQPEYRLLVGYQLGVGIKGNLGDEKAKVFIQKRDEEANKGTNPYADELRLMLLSIFNGDAKNMKPFMDYFSMKLKQYLLHKDSDEVAICYWKLSSYYGPVGLHERAIYYLKKSLQYVNPEKRMHPIISRIWLYRGMDLYINQMALVGASYEDMGDYPQAIHFLGKAFQLANNRRLDFWDSSIITYASHHIAFSKLMLNETDSVLALLNQSLDMAYQTKETDNQAMAWYVKGFYYLKRKQWDSSIWAIGECLKIKKETGMQNSNNMGLMMPNYILAQIYLHQNKLKEASLLLEEECANLQEDRPHLIQELKLLTRVYLKMGKSEEAEKYFNQILQLQDAIQAELLKNQSNSFEVEKQIEEAEQAIENLAKEKEKANLSRNYLSGIAIILLLLAAIAYYRFIVTRKQQKIIVKEKQRSEDLLLNILPHDIAEELKDSGNSKAREIEKATVMFTDFKDFTGISQKFSPQGLVAEIHECFSAFDLIMQKHGVEKIKTIGDSYMAAGGLPVPNKTHASDVVKAALEIQEFMRNHKVKKEAAGEQYFEIRIGVHTGPVVAGIVGVKKFAYDIWGDTVNTASRMESSGEVGKVNVSGSTFEFIKDEFTCEHRGKIKAKNKGEIDMYFVS